MALVDELNIELSAKVCARYNVFGLHNPMEVKNNYVHVTTQRILNKFIEINFSVGCCLFQPKLPVLRSFIFVLAMVPSERAVYYIPLLFKFVG